MPETKEQKLARWHGVTKKSYKNIELRLAADDCHWVECFTVKREITERAFYAGLLAEFLDEPVDLGYQGELIGGRLGSMMMAAGKLGLVVAGTWRCTFAKKHVVLPRCLVVKLDDYVKRLGVNRQWVVRRLVERFRLAVRESEALAGN